ncbi:hypothetical protein TUM19329_21590 [Legionella antarctica]|uniref:Uncharacterized protein n=1 Tax=Legionella antarctica TaxID=2708020 RepID=A0A6F8T5W6_9GAMM|nr:hypothetical protein [Legionella antarctica]BCA95798.1 hypothetical protein TUM19329_21590 [Legionella antarctica]
MNRNNKEQESTLMGTQEEFEQVKVNFDDLITIIKGIEFAEDRNVSAEYERMISEYQELCTKALQGSYDVTALKEIYHELECFYQESVDLSPVIS